MNTPIDSVSMSVCCFSAWSVYISKSAEEQERCLPWAMLSYPPFTIVTDRHKGIVGSYYLSPEALAHSAAFLSCESLGGQFLHLDCLKEYDLLQKFLDTENTNGVQTVWVGVTDPHSYGEWVTSKDLLPLDEDVWTWGDHEPSSHGSEDCVIMYLPTKTLDDRKCDQTHNFICEMDAT